MQQNMYNPFPTCVISKPNLEVAYSSDNLENYKSTRWCSYSMKMKQGAPLGGIHREYNRVDIMSAEPPYVCRPDER